jgi:hypothetical protein
MWGGLMSQLDVPSPTVQEVRGSNQTHSKKWFFVYLPQLALIQVYHFIEPMAKGWHCRLILLMPYMSWIVLTFIQFNMLWSACMSVCLRRLDSWIVSKLDHLVTIQYVAINNHELMIWAKENSHHTTTTVLWAKSNMPLFWGRRLLQHMDNEQEIIVGTGYMSNQTIQR